MVGELRAEHVGRRRVVDAVRFEQRDDRVLPLLLRQLAVGDAQLESFEVVGELLLDQRDLRFAVQALTLSFLLKPGKLSLYLSVICLAFTFSLSLKPGKLSLYLSVIGLALTFSLSLKRLGLRLKVLLVSGPLSFQLGVSRVALTLSAFLQLPYLAGEQRLGELLLRILERLPVLALLDQLVAVSFRDLDLLFLLGEHSRAPHVVQLLLSGG